jgi:hypothetical protein
LRYAKAGQWENPAPIIFSGAVNAKATEIYAKPGNGLAED